MARVKRRPGIGRVTRYCVPVADAPAGPTVLLNADWSTDTILNDSDLPITNGDPVKSWAFATGGTATQALAVAAGASPQYLVWTTANGVHTGGNSAAVTLPTPVTIPADTDCVIYLKCVLASFGDIFIGKTDNQSGIIFGGGAGWYISNATDGVGAYGEPTDAAYLARARRSGSVWYFAWTGQSEITVAGSLLGSSAISVDTLLGKSSSTGLDSFTPTGNFLQKAYIFHGSSTPDTAYETANGGVL